MIGHYDIGEERKAVFGAGFGKLFETDVSFGWRKRQRASGKACCDEEMAAYYLDPAQPRHAGRVRGFLAEGAERIAELRRANRQKARSLTSKEAGYADLRIGINTNSAARRVCRRLGNEEGCQMQISYEVGGRGRGEGRRSVRRREFPSRYVSERGKTAMAYQAYVDLMQTAEWIRELAGKHLVALNMSMVEYRLMEWIYRHGPQYQMELSRRFQCSKQNVAWLIGRLAGFGWLKRATGRLPAKRAVAGGWPSSAKAPEGGPSSAKAADDQRASGSKKKGVRVRVKPAGRPVIRVFLTEQGRAVIAEAMRKHAKYVKAEMRALDGREQQTLSRLCRKLQEGDPLRFFREIKRFDWDDEEQDRRVGLTGLAVRLDKALKRVEQAKSAGIAGGGARALPAPAGVQRPQITMQIRRPDGSFPRP